MRASARLGAYSACYGLQRIAPYVERVALSIRLALVFKGLTLMAILVDRLQVIQRIRAAFSLGLDMIYFAGQKQTVLCLALRTLAQVTIALQYPQAQLIPRWPVTPGSARSPRPFRFV